MGCNCNKRTLDKVMEYAEDNSIIDENKDNWFYRLLGGIGTMLFTILLFVLFILIAVPMVVYVAVCLLFGKQPHFVLKNFLKKRND